MLYILCRLSKILQRLLVSTQRFSTVDGAEFITVCIAAGLNWVRIPIGFWAIETRNDEPFLVGTSWSYFLKACAITITPSRMWLFTLFSTAYNGPGSMGFVSILTYTPFRAVKTVGYVMNAVCIIICVLIRAPFTSHRIRTILARVCHSLSSVSMLLISSFLRRKRKLVGL